jgi:hypothetical protein
MLQCTTLHPSITPSEGVTYTPWHLIPSKHHIPSRHHITSKHHAISRHHIYLYSKAPHSFNAPHYIQSPRHLKASRMLQSTTLHQSTTPSPCVALLHSTFRASRCCKRDRTMSLRHTSNHLTKRTPCNPWESGRPGPSIYRASTAFRQQGNSQMLPSGPPIGGPCLTQLMQPVRRDTPLTKNGTVATMSN